MASDKLHIQALAETCRLKGIKHIVFSPGSRSAPMVIAFSSIKEITSHVIADERSAAFFAMGIAQQTQNTVAVVCTSGTAVLNFAPAICEAFYQQIPLLIITADRPKEYIGIGENQAIDQSGIFKNYSKACFGLPENVQEAAQVTADAIHLSRFPFFGPVHINAPLREPLYGKTETPLPSFTTKDLASLPEQKFELPQSGQTLVLCGLQHFDKQRNELLKRISERSDAVVIAEPVANFSSLRIINDPDSLLAFCDENRKKLLVPETVISIGKQFVSKRLRQFLRNAKVPVHIHVSTDEGKWNGIGAQHFHHVFSNPSGILQQLSSKPHVASPFYKDWMNAKDIAAQKQFSFSKTAPFSDWKVFEYLIKNFPENSSVQYGNSSPIRYANLFKHHGSIRVFSNRGTSGIDGCLSTAVGAALANPEQLTICILGDVSFFYDSNALWNNALARNLRIVMINNSGGNIFNLIDGPESVPGFEKFFLTRHRLTAEHLAAMYGLSYFHCDNLKDLDFVLPEFYSKRHSAGILEIKTDGTENAEVWKGYFRSNS